jgi:hypothetical protein
VATSQTTGEARREAWLFALALTVSFHFAWEMAQSPFFEKFADGWRAGTVRCLVASFGDLVIATLAYTATSLVFRRFDWPFARDWRFPAVAWIGASELGTIGLEMYAVQQGRWAYALDMPTLFGIGLLPLAQWVLVPLITLFALRAIPGRIGPPPGRVGNV